MTKEKTPSAKSSCCDSSIHCHIRKNGLTNECDACGEPCDANQAPDEGEMEREIRYIENRLNSATRWCNDDMSHEDIPVLLRFVKSLQSRLKQAEAERDSYRGDAERMHEALNSIAGFHGNLHCCRECHADHADGLAEDARKCLGSLSNQYPSRK